MFGMTYGFKHGHISSPNSIKINIQQNMYNAFFHLHKQKK